MKSVSSPEQIAVRPLSKPELLGWRQMWDGWPVCPDCVAEVGEWPVPVDYSTAIAAEPVCVKCRQILKDSQ